VRRTQRLLRRIGRAAVAAPQRLARRPICYRRPALATRCNRSTISLRLGYSLFLVRLGRDQRREHVSGLLADLGSDLGDDRLNAMKRGEIPWIALSLRSINILCSLPINSSARLAAPSLASAFSTFCTSLERTHSSVLLSELLFKRTNIDNINNNIRWVSVGTGSRHRRLCG